MNEKNTTTERGEKGRKTMWARIVPERATDEWQRRAALPPVYDFLPPEKQKELQTFYAVTDEECQQLREVYAAFPDIAVMQCEEYAPEEWIIIDCKPEDAAKLKEAIWLAEQMGGVYEGDRAQFDEDWSKGKYEPDGIFSIAGTLLDVLGEYQPQEGRHDLRKVETPRTHETTPRGRKTASQGTQEGANDAAE